MSHYRKGLLAAPVIAGAITLAAAGTAVAPGITGTGRADRIVGSRRVDTIAALGGPDRVFALAGDDRVALGEGGDFARAGFGNDRLHAHARGDPFTHTLNGDEGDDRILARDGHRDVVTCGPGLDRAQADRADSVAADCEVVRVHTRARG